MTRKQGSANKTTRKPAGRRVWTKEEDALLLNSSLSNSDVVQRIEGVTSAAVACRRNRLLNAADPNRARQVASGLPTWSAERAARKRAKKAVAAEENGIYTAVSRLAERCIWNVLQQQRGRDAAATNSKANRPRINKRKREMRATDERWRIEANLRSRLADFVRTHGLVKGASTEELIGATWDELHTHLSKQLNPGDSLLDKDTDHIFPMCRYNLSNATQQRKCMHYSNLQPLTDGENGSKGGQLPTKAMAAKVARWAWPAGVTEDMLPDCYPTWRTPLRML